MEMYVHVGVLPQCVRLQLVTWQIKVISIYGMDSCFPFHTLTLSHMHTHKHKNGLIKKIQNTF